MNQTRIKILQDILLENEPSPSLPWQLTVFSHEDCQSYLLWNKNSLEALWIDPKKESTDEYISQIAKLPKEITYIAVIDTHTHADHISSAAFLAEQLQTALVMHHLSPSKRVHLRVCNSTTLPSKAGPIRLLLTPGHTPDGICVLWGPFAFTGDTVLFGDVGRDDLPGGDGQSHYKSLQLLKQSIAPDTLVLPGHDHKGGRISSWKTQLKLNSSLTQAEEDFVREANEFDAPAPALLKKSLSENFR